MSPLLSPDEYNPNDPNNPEHMIGHENAAQPVTLKNTETRKATCNICDRKEIKNRKGDLSERDFNKISECANIMKASAIRRLDEQKLRFTKRTGHQFPLSDDIGSWGKLTSANGLDPAEINHLNVVKEFYRKFIACDDALQPRVSKSKTQRRRKRGSARGSARRRISSFSRRSSRASSAGQSITSQNGGKYNKTKKQKRKKKNKRRKC